MRLSQRIFLALTVSFLVLVTMSSAAAAQTQPPVRTPESTTQTAPTQVPRALPRAGMLDGGALPAASASLGLALISTGIFLRRRVPRRD
jgi:hypothetical protein